MMNRQGPNQFEAINVEPLRLGGLPLWVAFEE